MVLDGTLMEYLESHFPIWKCLASTLPGGAVSPRSVRTVSGYCTRSFESVLPLLGKAIYRSYETGIFECPKEFSTKKNSNLPKLLVELFSRVYTPEGALRPVGPSLINVHKKLLQLTMCFYKVERAASREAENTLVTDFLKLQNHLYSDLNSTEEDRQFLRRCRRRLSQILKNFDPREITPRHGPGAVFESQKNYEKWSMMWFYPDIDQVYPSDQYQYLSSTHLCDVGSPFIQRNTPPMTRMCVVPKNADTGRLIAIEEKYPQYLKLGIMDALYKHIAKSSIRHNVNFVDQTINHSLACLGSYNGYYATIDLKAASDSVSVDLVNRLFPKTFLKYTDPLRATCTVWNSVRHSLKTYATMGSALCFPVEALTFWVLLREHLGTDEVFVYGDDIVIPSSMVESAIDMFRNFGITVNQAKTFYRGLFRESCGEDYLAGNSVSVSKWRKPPRNLDELRVRCDQIVPFLNDMTRTWGGHVTDNLIHVFVREFGCLPVTVRSDMQGFAVYTEAHTSLNASFLRSRWNRNLQKFEFRLPSKRVRQTRVEDSWYEVMRSVLGSASMKGTCLYDDPNKVIPCWEWVTI